MRKLCWLAVSAALLAGCSSVSVRRDYDASHDFSGLRTYAWQHDEQPKAGSPRIDNDLLDERIRRAVEQTLAVKGFTLVGRADADMLAAYFLDYDRRLSGSSVSLGAGRGSYGRYAGVGYSTGTGLSEYDLAVLTIDLINPSDGKTVWRGVGTRTAYEGSSPEKMSRIVNQAVSQILKNFPPQ